jgi:hypothetical protein
MATSDARHAMPIVKYEAQTVKIGTVPDPKKHPLQQ